MCASKVKMLVWVLVHSKLSINKLFVERDININVMVELFGGVINDQNHIFIHCHDIK